MADFFADMKAGVTAAQATFGTSFTLNGNVFMPFKGFFAEASNPDAAQLGVFEGDAAAYLEAGRKQFDDLGITPEEGDTVKVDGRVFRCVRLNSDEVSHEFILKRDTH